MLIRKFSDCTEITAGDNCVLRECLHPDKQDVDLRYSLAHAKVGPGEITWKHSLKTSEVYYILLGLCSVLRMLGIRIWSLFVLWIRPGGRKMKLWLSKAALL